MQHHEDILVDNISCLSSLPVLELQFNGSLMMEVWDVSTTVDFVLNCHDWSAKKILSPLWCFVRELAVVIIYLFLSIHKICEGLETE
jgi:hypothetical protein